MKKIRLLSLLGIILFASTLAGCGGNKEVNSNNTGNDEGNLVIEDTTPENDTVINYNDTLVDLASQCIMSESNVRSVYNDENAKVEDIQKTIEKTINECTKAGNDIEELGDREGDSSLKNGVLSIIEKEIALYTKFSQLLPYFEKDELTEDEEAAYDNLFSEIEALDSELTQSNDNLISIQEEFAKNHGFELESEATEEYAE